MPIQTSEAAKITDWIAAICAIIAVPTSVWALVITMLKSDTRGTAK